LERGLQLRVQAQQCLLVRSLERNRPSFYRHRFQLLDVFAYGIRIQIILTESRPGGKQNQSRYQGCAY